NMGEWWVGEHAVGNEPVASDTAAAGEVLPNDPEIVDRHVSEVRAAGAFANGPNTRRGGLQPLIDLDVAACVQFDTSVGKPDIGGVRDAPCCGEDVTAFECLIAGGRAQADTDVLAGAAVHGERFDRCH